MGLGGARAGGWSRSPPPAAVCGGSLPALPGSGQFSPQKSVRELSARAAARRGAGWARLTGSPTRPPTSRAPRTGPRRPLRRAPRASLAHPSLSSSPAAGRAAPETPRGLRLGKRAVRPGCGLLAMSAARDTSGHFPLHLLVWNNDYRQLERELRDQVRGGAGSGRGSGGRSTPGSFSPREPSPALCPRAPQTPSVLRSWGKNHPRTWVECLLCARPCAEGFNTLTPFDFATIQGGRCCYYHVGKKGKLRRSEVMCFAQGRPPIKHQVGVLRVAAGSRAHRPVLTSEALPKGVRTRRAPHPTHPFCKEGLGWVWSPGCNSPGDLGQGIFPLWPRETDAYPSLRITGAQDP